MNTKNVDTRPRLSLVSVDTRLAADGQRYPVDPSDPRRLLTPIGYELSHPDGAGGVDLRDLDEDEGTLCTPGLEYTTEGDGREGVVGARIFPPIDWDHVTPHPELARLEDRCGGCGAPRGEHLTREADSLERAERWPCNGWKEPTSSSTSTDGGAT